MLTLFLMEMRPLKSPSARYCPSFVQLHAVTLLFTLCLDTDFCSGDHNPAARTKYQTFYRT